MKSVHMFKHKILTETIVNKDGGVKTINWSKDEYEQMLEYCKTAPTYELQSEDDDFSLFIYSYNR